MESQPSASYIHLLEEELLLRKKRNGLYSLRAFAQHLELSPAYVSLVFSGKRHLSAPTATKIAKKLKWNRTKQKYFVALLDFEKPRNEAAKESSLRRLQEIEAAQIDFHSLEVDTFAAISDWQHGAILAMLTLKNIKLTTSLIAKKLKLDKFEVQNFLRRLQRLGLIRAEKQYWVSTEEFWRIKATPSLAIKNYHKQILNLAAGALDNQKFEERDFLNMSLTVDPSQIAYAKKRILEFRNELAKILEGQNPTEVYQFSSQLFKLTQ